ncbi:MAG: PQQ-binding-like beta-propeller repeat protein [Caldiserica bacterium]|nr:PQQ-binding-like beta-propeller repeat protein [Caldisericota bacterium]
MKKIIILLAAILVSTLSNQSMLGATTYRTIVHKIGTNVATIDGKSIKLSMLTEIKNNTTFIYTPDLGKFLNIKFPWSPNNKMAGGIDLVTNTSLMFKDGAATATIDGDIYKIAVKPYIKTVNKSQYFMVPLKYACEVLGCSVGFDAKKNLVIKKPLALPNVSWTTNGRDESRRFAVPNGTAPKGENLIQDWVIGNGDEETSPLFFEGKVLFNDQMGWTCYNASTKNKIWRIDNKVDSIGKFALLQQMSYSNGLVFSGIGPTAYDSQTGKAVWQKKDTNTDDCFTFGDMVLACKTTQITENTYQYAICCFKAKDGTVVWKIDNFGSTLRSAWITASKDKLIIKDQCYDIKTGKKLFVMQGLPKEIPYPGVKSFFDDSGNIVAYTKTCIYILDGKTGKQLTNRELNLGLNVVLHRSKIYCISTGASVLRCLNPKTLADEWETPVEADGSSCIIPSGYNLVVITDKFIAGFGTGTGKRLWTQTNDKLYNIAQSYEYAIVDKYIYITSLQFNFLKLTYRIAIKP